MPYININEYDYTITGPKNYSGNIVAVPINASDGPADRWITVHTYDDFVQIFGPNPGSSSLSEFGNSWEYAANLLLQGMSVCVRRITHVLDEETGENTKDLLPGVSVAKTIIKVKDIIGNTTSSDSYESEKIPVIDVAKHAQLLSSHAGDPVDNPSYFQCNYEEDGNTIIGAFPTPHVLQTETIKILENADKENESNEEKKLLTDVSFADVTLTNSEWRYVGKKINPHYKYKELDVPTSMIDIYKMNQTVDDNGNSYVEGDFFITKSNHVVKFESYTIPNPNLLISSQIQYPSELLTTIKNMSDEDLTDKFVNVTYDATNKNAIEKVWRYSGENETVVYNHLFREGTVAHDDDKSIKIFKTKNELPTTNVAIKSFAGVKSNNKIYVYEKGTNGNDGWKETAVTIDNLLDLESPYSVKVKIPFECTDVSINTEEYKTHFNWRNTGEANYIDENNKHFIYLPYIYWENSNDPINTHAHKILSGAKVNINSIVINKKADTSKTEFNLQVNGYNDFNFNKDYSDTRLVSGNFGLTNNSSEVIRIYGFKIQQKDASGNLYSAYDSNLENIKNSNGRINSSPLLVFYNREYETVLDNPIPKLDDTTSEDKWYIELEPETTMYYNLDITDGIFTVKVAGYEDFKVDIHTFNSSHGRYDFLFTSKVNNTEEPYVVIDKNFIPVITEQTSIDFNDVPLLDGLGNFNLFIAEYKSPGEAGNNLNVRIKTIINQGIYAYVYKNNQRLEKLELCSFRYRNANTGKVDILNMETEKDKIWKSIVSKFGIRISASGVACDFNLKPIEKADELTGISGNYVNIYINDKVLKTISSLDYVKSLYTQSETIICQLKNGANPDDEHVKHEVPKCYIPLKDKYKYDITFVSNGGYVDKITYPKNVVLSFATNSDIRLIEDALLELAETRKDCVAYLDVPYDLPLQDVPSYFEHISSSYAAAYCPWAKMILATGAVKWMSPSFVQLYTHARSIRNGNKMYLPPAGVRRAQVPEITEVSHELSSKYLTLWQNTDTLQYINPIIWINGFDYTVYGQKTLYNMVSGSRQQESALQDLNVRLITNQLKKLIFKTCIELTFELNNILTWNEFKSKIEPTLSTMHGEGVLSDYNILMGTETMTKADLNSGHIVGTVRISVARAVTDWDINFELTPNNVTFTGLDYNSAY